MLRPVIRTLTPIIKFGNLIVSVGSQGWLVATDWLVTIGMAWYWFLVPSILLTSLFFHMPVTTLTEPVSDLA